jgi:hypothetical protein
MRLSQANLRLRLILVQTITYVVRLSSRHGCQRSYATDTLTGEYATIWTRQDTSTAPFAFFAESAQ